jgi:hypothetical protein
MRTYFWITFFKRHGNLRFRQTEGQDVIASSSLVVRVPGYKSGGPGFDSRALQEQK